MVNQLKNNGVNLMVQQRVLVTGCAGFIGSNLVDRLLELGNEVIGVDNLVTGKLRNINNAMQNKGFTFYNLDLLNEESLNKIIEMKIDTVYHLAANADIRFGSIHPLKDFNQNVKVTLNVLEFCRKNEIRKIIFSSTGAIYGEPRVFPTPENCPLPIQTSLYGASKIAAEGFIQAYSETFEIKSIIFRFVSILGPRYSHGHVIDFYNQLMKDPNKLKVLGDGSQNKSYLHVNDCVSALESALMMDISKSEVFNLGTKETCKVEDSIKHILKYLNLDPDVSFGQEKKGWIGDNPFILLDIQKMEGLGWSPKHSIKESIEDTLDYFIEQDTNI